MTLDDQGRGASSRNRSSGRDRDRSSQQSSPRRSSGSGGSRRNDRDGTGKSRGYSSFGRHNRERVQEKDPDFRDQDSKLIQPEDPLRDGFESFSSCMSEKDRLNRTRSKVSVSNRAVGVSLEMVIYLKRILVASPLSENSHTLVLRTKMENKT